MANANESTTLTNFIPKRQKIQSIMNRSHEVKKNKKQPERYPNIQFLSDDLIFQQIHQSPLVRFNLRLLKCLKQKAAIDHSLQKQLKMKTGLDLLCKRKNRYKKSITQESKTTETACSLQMLTNRQLKLGTKKSLIPKRNSDKKQSLEIQCINYPILNEREHIPFKRNTLTKQQEQNRDGLIERILSKNLIKVSANNKEYRAFKRYSYQTQHPFCSLKKPKFETENIQFNNQELDIFFKKIGQDQKIETKDSTKEKYDSIRFSSKRYDHNQSQYQYNRIEKKQSGFNFHKFHSYKKVAQAGDENEQFGPWTQNPKKNH